MPAFRPPPRSRALAAALLALATACGAAGLRAEPAREEPVLLKADEVSHDGNAGIVTARGGVELSQGGRVLLADTVSYNRRTDAAIASGNIVLMEPDGEVVFASYAELDTGLKNGFIEHPRLRLADGSRLAARRARREAGRRKTMERAVFTPCLPCKDNPERPPLWRIRAAQVVHDEQARDIAYRDATLDMFGIPVAWAPYLVHPDPTVERRSGLLAPTVGHSDQLGFILGQPWFQVIDDARDIELEPIVYSREGAILRARYRQAFDNGSLDLAGTAGLLEDRGAADGGSGLKGSADLEGRFALDGTWRSGFDWRQASGRTYLRRYRLGDDEMLTSRLFVEGFRARNHASVEAYRFQDLRAGANRRRQPRVLPLARYSLDGEPDRLGGRARLDAAAASLFRGDGPDSRKVSLLAGWKRPFRAPAGDVYTFAATLQSDLYDIRAPAGPGGGGARVGRLFPQAALEWRFPLARQTASGSQIVEPTVNLVAGPNGGNPPEIPNEDSQSFEYDDTNIFEPNRFYGGDRVTSGARIDYGARAAMFDDDLGTARFFLGQSYRFFGDDFFGYGSGLEDRFSDLVGHVGLSPAEGLDLEVRYRLDNETLKPRRGEVGARLYGAGYRVEADYVALNEQFSTVGLGDREQLDLKLGVRLTDHWSASTRLLQNLSGASRRPLAAEVGFAYIDECFAISLDYGRRNLRDEGIEPEERIFLRIDFKHLGSIRNF